MNREREGECTQTCRSRQHGAQITAAVIRGTEAQAIAYLKSLCQRCCFVADATGKTALHTAASCGKRKIVKWLVSRGAQLNQRDQESGYTPLHRALFYGHLHVACTLIQAGCSVSTLDYDSLTPLDHLVFDRPPIVSFTGSLPTHVYVWGTNTNYNLGQTSQQARGTPECLEAVHREGHGITDVALSKFHTIFVSSNGRVYTCGHGHGGRLGVDTNAPIITPRPIKAFTHTNIVKAAVGPDHSLFLTDAGQVFSCGSNFHHQLGLNPPPEHVYTPRMITWHKSHKDIFAGIGAAKFHSVIWTSRMLYTFGLNAGQLGFFKNANERTVITPRTVTSIVLKEDGNLACVGVSDGATVLSTSHGDVYVLHQYQIRKVTSKMLGIVKIACIGGCLDSKVGATGLKEHGGDDLKIAVLTGGGAGHLYIWTQQSSHLSRCLFSINRKISVVDFCLSRHCLGIVTDEGEAFSGVMLPNRERKTMDKVSVKKAFGPSRQLIEFLDYSSCVTIRLTRLPALHRTVSIMCDPKGHNFAALQNDPSSFLLDLPEVIPSTWKAEFKCFLEEASEMDTTHDVLIVCGTQKFPAHSYILASHSGYFHYHLIESDNHTSDRMNPQKIWSINKQNGKKCFVFPDVQPALFKEVLMYMYTGFCPLLTLQISGETNSLNGVFDVSSNNAHNVYEQVLSNATQQRLAFSVYAENKKIQTPSKPRKKKGRKVSEVKSGECNPFHSASLLARKLHIPSLVRELDKKKMYAHLEESDLTNEKEEKIILEEEPYSREKYKELWDVMISSKSGDVLGAHKCILAARLEYFRCMFSAGWLEATTNQTLSIPLPTNILSVVLDYLYEDDSVELQHCRDPEFVCNVLAVADQFLITRLREICEQVLSGLMTLKNSAELLEFASRCNAPKLKASTMQFICLNLSALLENGSLLSINNSELLEEISKYYKGFVRRMACRMLTPYDCIPYAEELEQHHEDNPVALPESDEELEDSSSVKGEQVTTDGGGPGSARKKKRPHRNSQGDGRCRKASASSSVSVSSNEYDPYKDLEDDLETLSFHDLKDRVSMESSGGNELQANSVGGNVFPLKEKEYCDDTTSLPACNEWKKVNRKRSTSGPMSLQDSPDKENIDSQSSARTVSTLPEVNPGTSESSSRSVETAVPQFPTLQDAIVSTQKTSCATKTSKISKLSQKQRKKIAAEANAADVSKEEQIKMPKQSSPWNSSTPVWGKDNNSTTAQKITSGSESLADIIKAEEKKVTRSPPVTIPMAKRIAVKPNNNNQKQVSPGSCWSTGKSSGAWSMVATSPPDSPNAESLPSPSYTHLKKPVVNSSSSTPSTPSFSHILLEEETLSDNLIREHSKPLSLIQMEDQAIEELLAFYGAAECFEEKITVTRVRKAVINPIWSK